MARKSWAFGKKNSYGIVESRDTGKTAEFPPYNASDLNSTDLGDLGLMQKDEFGRVFMKVRYAQTTTAGAAGYLVAFPGATAVTTHGTTACTTSSITTTQNVSFLNAMREWFLGGQGATIATSTIAGFIRRIYSSSGGTNTHTHVTSEIKREELNPSRYDGNRLLNIASPSVEDGLTTGISTLSVWRPITDVVLANSTAATIISIPCGVLLGDVTAAGGAYETSDASGTVVAYRSTWIQVFGPGLVYCPNGVNTTANTTMLYASTTAGASLATTLAATALTYSQSIGMALVTDATAANRLVPTFINPGYYKFFMGL